MKRALVAFLFFVNLLSLIAFVAGVLLIVVPVLAHADVEATLAIVCLGIGVSAPAITAGVLFRTQIVSSGNTWKEIVEDIKPLIARGGNSA